MPDWAEAWVYGFFTGGGFCLTLGVWLEGRKWASKAVTGTRMCRGARFYEVRDVTWKRPIPSGRVTNEAFGEDEDDI